MSEGFGARLREEMQKRGWNQTQLAEAADLTPAAVSRHLERSKPPHIDSVAKYSGALGVARDWLAYGRGSRLDRPAEPTVERLLGSVALERVLAAYDWPDIEVAIIDRAMADLRSEASATGKDRPESVWKLRVSQVLRELTRPEKDAPRRAAAEAVDLTQESPEIRRVRKTPKRL